MANIGLRYAVYAPLTVDTASTTTYGTGKIAPKAIKLDMKLNISDSPLYADDGVTERAREFIDGDLTFTGDDLDSTVKSEWLGSTLSDETVGTETVKVLTSTGEDTPPYFGFGCIVSKIKGSTRYYRALFFTRVQFGEPDESAETKSQQINWQTQPIIGKLSKRQDDEWKEEITTTSLTTAKTWLNTKLNVSTT